MGVIGTDAKNAANGAFVIWNGAVGERYVAFLRVAFALQNEQPRFVKRTLMRATGRFDPGCKLIPNLVPELRSGLCQGWMLGMQKSSIGIVVKVQQLV